MVTELDTDIGPEVVDILNEFGADAVFLFEDNPEDGYDATSGDVPDVVGVEHTVKISPPQPFDKKLVDEDLILSTDLRTLIAGLDLPFVPYTTQTMTFKGENYTIVTVSPIHSGELVAAFDLQMRALNAD